MSEDISQSEDEDVVVEGHLSEVPPTVTHEDSIAKRTSKLGGYLTRHHLFFAESEHSPIWMYNNNIGIWEPKGVNYIQKSIKKYLADINLFKKHQVNEIVAYVRYDSYDEDVELGGPPNKIVLANGVYNLETDELEDFNSDDYQITAIPVVYDPDAKCLNFEKFLKEVLIPNNDDDKEAKTKGENNVIAIGEFCGNCLFKDTSYPTVLVLLGGGDNGKTTLLEILRRFLGHKNVCGISPQQLEKDKYKMANLHGKLANVAGDIPATPLESSSTIKWLTGGDSITVEEKFHAPFELTNYAKFIFSANKLFKSYDPSDAFHRRFRLIDFPNKFLASDPDSIPRIKLVASLTTPKELSGIFNLAIEGLKRLQDQGQLTGEETVEDKRLSFVKRSDPIEYFVLKYLYRNPKGKMEKAKIFDLYVDLCHHLGDVPTNDAWFAKRLRRIVPYIKTGEDKKSGSRKPVWKGMGFWSDDYYQDLGLQHKLVDKKVEDTVAGQPTKSLDEVFDDPSLQESFGVDEDEENES